MGMGFATLFGRLTASEGQLSLVETWPLLALVLWHCLGSVRFLH